jgi:tagatose 1,6-diphosphate aldolase
MPGSKVKLEQLKSVADEKGIIRALALDHRQSLRRAMAAELQMDSSQVSSQQIEELKAVVVEVLSPFSSGVLLDPEFGIPAARRRAPGCGLLLAYEDSGYDNSRPGRLPNLVSGWSVRRLLEAGATCIKILIYYTPFEDGSINEEKKAFVERVGSECFALGVPFFLELVGYDVQGLDPLERARRRPEMVGESLKHFSAGRFLVDVFKIEIPVDLKFTAGTASFTGGQAAYSRKEALELFRATARLSTRPFIYLSAGVSEDQFRESLELANEAATPYSGVLCGRATWSGALKAYADGGSSAAETWLQDRGVKNILSLNEVLDGAVPFWDFDG